MTPTTKLIVAIYMSFVLFASCVETETKRTTKKVDVSGAQLYELRLDKPRLRVALSVPAHVEADIAGMLFVEVDDGEYRYGFDGKGLSGDTAEPAGFSYSPWINTPDSGRVVMTFHLAYANGAVIVSDRLSVELKPDRYWEVKIGVTDHDPCLVWTQLAVCRSYALPRDIEASGDGQLYVAWHEHQIAVTDEP